MAKKQDSAETVPLEDVVLSNVFTQEAILNLLEKKGVVTKEEVMDEMKKIMEKGENKV
jgi:hypothetical protein